MYRSMQLAIITAFIILSGCSSAPGFDPILPDEQGQDPSLGQVKEPFFNLPTTAPGHHLAGIYKLNFDLAAGEINVVPLREAGTHYNATDILLPPDCNDCVSIVVTDHDHVARRIKVNVFIKNPTELTVYDVRGIFITDQPGWKLINNWGYTPLYDDSPPITFNPFKEFYWGGYFKSGNYSFWPDSLRVQEYIIDYPKNPDFQGIKFAVDVSWPGLCQEPFLFRTTGPGALSGGGDTYVFEAETYDHQNYELAVIVDASPLGAGLVELKVTSANAYGANVFGRTWVGEFDFHGVGDGVAPGTHELVATAYSGASIPNFQVIPVEVSSEIAPVEVTPPWLNIMPNILASKENLLFIGDSYKILIEDYSDP